MSIHGVARSALTNLRNEALSRYRATGADFPFGDPLPWHGVAMEGYFWRLTDPASGRVIIALVGINTPRSGGRWATVGIAAEPEGVLATAELPQAWADADRFGLRVGTAVYADAKHARVALGDPSGGESFGGESSIDIEVTEPRPWPHRALGGSSVFQSVPGLNQYWHPWLLGGRASGSVTVAGVRTAIDGWQVYGEKNWGRDGFPEAWWWGQAQGFDDANATVAFAGGQITAGPTVFGRGLATEVTALVVALPDGRVVRLGDPMVSPVRTRARPGSWSLHGHSRRWEVAVQATADPGRAFVLPVPLVEERRNSPGALEHLAGDLDVRVREHAREVWHGKTTLAGLELGGRDRAEAELAARGGDPTPR